MLFPGVPKASWIGFLIIIINIFLLLLQPILVGFANCSKRSQFFLYLEQISFQFWVHFLLVSSFISALDNSPLIISNSALELSYYLLSGSSCCGKLSSWVRLFTLSCIRVQCLRVDSQLVLGKSFSRLFKISRLLYVSQHEKWDMTRRCFPEEMKFFGKN